jgi:glutamate/tyrosine decarboxylase-like PLP-dependent enzyme
VRCAGHRFADLLELDLWELLNLGPTCALDAAGTFEAAVGDVQRARSAAAAHSLSTLGFQEFGRRLAREFGDSLPPAVVLVPSTAHYSWEKICHSLGIGGGHLVHVPVDERFRMDPDALWKTLRHLERRHQPVIACVTVVGTTEESAVDRVDRVLEVREQAGRELGMAFHLHADAAWGGYAISITRAADGSRRSYHAALADYAPEVWPEEGVYKALCAVESTDSVTIDPHKLGFIPYPAGAISFADRRGRDLVAIDAPYLFHRGASEWGYIGRFIFEGSKPGAAAAAVAMAHKVLPLDERGYGRLIGETSRGALALHRRLSGGSWEPFRVVPLPPSDLNIVCFAVSHQDFTTLDEANAFTTRIYQAMSVGGAGHPDPRRLEFFVTKTELRTGEYGAAAMPTVEKLGFSEPDYRRAGGLSVLRCTVMDPFLASGAGRVDFIEAFAANLRAVMECCK